jgi:hypothetical protein
MPQKPQIPNISENFLKNPKIGINTPPRSFASYMKGARGEWSLRRLQPTKACRTGRRQQAFIPDI